jgi:threonyl-tRNA synthetase
VESCLAIAAVGRRQVLIKGECDMLSVTVVAPDGVKTATTLALGALATDALRATKGLVAARVDGTEVDLSYALQHGQTIEPILSDSEAGRRIIRHSAAHVMAQAVQDLYPGTRLGIGPPIADGFYYDFDSERPFTPDDLVAIEQRMRQIIQQRQKFVRRVVSLPDARSELAGEPFKLELLEFGAGPGSGIDNRDSTSDVANGSPSEAEFEDEADGSGVEVGGSELTIYDNRIGDETVWRDLCRGPHVPTTRDIPAFSLLRNAAAYWRGSEKNPQLQRIYGTAWESRGVLKAHIERLAEIDRRDHRRIGKELELFHFDASAPGMPYWLPNGMRILNALLAFWRDEHEERGYQEIASPLINNRTLWETSGHWDHYRDDMFVIERKDNSEPVRALKPMNCPNAMVVFNIRTRSYRDLPLRLSDCDALHRDERSGTLHGLLRVRKFLQDDAHIFVTREMIADEIERILDICDRFYGIFGLSFSYRLGTRPEGYIGDLKTWEEAEANLQSILHRRTAGDYAVERGGGAFYGPKIDILMSDVLGRQWQMGTVQLDFQLPRRFGCEYTDSDGRHQTPIVIHRVVYGSLERFLGIYIEHTEGAMPLWLAPTQGRIIPIANSYSDYAEDVRQTLRQGSVRVEVDGRDETLNARVRDAQRWKVPLTLVVGAQEAAERTVSVRLRGERHSTVVPLATLAEQLDIAMRRRLDLSDLVFG